MTLAGPREISSAIRTKTFSSLTSASVLQVAFAGSTSMRSGEGALKTGPLHSLVTGVGIWHDVSLAGFDSASASSAAGHWVVQSVSPLSGVFGGRSRAAYRSLVKGTIINRHGPLVGGCRRGVAMLRLQGILLRVPG